jgi:hypothetical protein
MVFLSDGFSCFLNSLGYLPFFLKEASLMSFDVPQSCNVDFDMEK